jgi:hypothetical protein
MSKILSLPAALAGYAIASPPVPDLSVFNKRTHTTTNAHKALIHRSNICIQQQSSELLVSCNVCGLM